MISALRSTRSVQNAKTCKSNARSCALGSMHVTTLVASASLDGRDAVFTAVCLFVSRITLKKKPYNY